MLILLTFAAVIGGPYALSTSDLVPLNAGRTGLTRGGAMAGTAREYLHLHSHLRCEEYDTPRRRQSPSPSHTTYTPITKSKGPPLSARSGQFSPNAGHMIECWRGWVFNFLFLPSRHSFRAALVSGSPLRSANDVDVVYVLFRGASFQLTAPPPAHFPTRRWSVSVRSSR
ncbi:type 11 methyltransferase [Anopheles sinensis]|uniref:Type 11 methyltransferase n=1 Tax=Anopheles sinensis TaxID=74873 RepID=A0A084WGD3_ANOSI|nr:type 11 methyltransferase [Anopheles sinensis]